MLRTAFANCKQDALPKAHSVDVSCLILLLFLLSSEAEQAAFPRSFPEIDDDTVEVVGEAVVVAASSAMLAECSELSPRRGTHSKLIGTRRTGGDEGMSERLGVESVVYSEARGVDDDEGEVEGAEVEAFARLAADAVSSRDGSSRSG